MITLSNFQCSILNCCIDRISDLPGRIHASRSTWRRTDVGPRVLDPTQHGLSGLPQLHLKQPPGRVPDPLRPPPERGDRVLDRHLGGSLQNRLWAAAERKWNFWGSGHDQVNILNFFSIDDRVSKCFFSKYVTMNNRFWTQTVLQSPYNCRRTPTLLFEFYCIIVNNYF